MHSIELHYYGVCTGPWLDSAYALLLTNCKICHVRISNVSGTPKK